MEKIFTVYGWQDEKGKITDLPYELRKLIYDEFVKIDFKEHEDYIKKLQSEGKEGYTAGYKSDISGLSFIIGPGAKEIIVLLNVSIQETGEKRVLTLKFFRDKKHVLIPEDGDLK